MSEEEGQQQKQLEEAMDNISQVKEVIVGLRNTLVNDGVGGDVADQIVLECMRVNRIEQEIELAKIQAQGGLSGFISRLMEDG